MTYVKVNNPLTKSIDGMMKDLFNEFPSTFSKTVREDVLHYPPVNIIDKPESYLIEMAAPGYVKADFNIRIEENILHISSDKKADALPENEKVVRREFGYKTFKRSFTINEKIDADQISARYENGILVLELPKKEIVKAGSKEITIQ